jgi:hypothetical protein
MRREECDEEDLKLELKLPTQRDGLTNVIRAADDDGLQIIAGYLTNTSKVQSEGNILRQHRKGD